jgi:hypothetical protein
MNLLDKVIVIQNQTGHPFIRGEEVTIFRMFANKTYDVCNKKGDCWRVKESEIVKNNSAMKQMTEAVINTAKRLLKSQNKVTTLEIKAEVIKTHPTYFWTQNCVSAIMDDAFKAGMFTYYDTTTGGNQHRVYSDPGVKVRNVKIKPQMTTTTKTKVAPKKAAKKTAKKAVKAIVKTVFKAPATKTIGRTKALELMENNRGHFFTATFISKKGERTINCQYLKDQTYSKLGYVKVKEAIKAKMASGDAIRQINLQTLKSLKIAGNVYKVK